MTEPLASHAPAQPYRLAFVLSLFFEYGGMQRNFLRIARACAARGCQVDVYTGGWQGPQPEDLKVHVVDTRALTNVWSNDRLAAQVAAARRVRHYDCVIGFTKLPGLDVYYAADPCFVARAQARRGWWYRLTPRYLAARRQEAAVFGAGSDSEILLLSPGEQANFIRHYGTDSGRFHILPPGIDRERLLQTPHTAETRAALRAGLGIGAADHLILNVGSRFRTKGIDRAILALAALPATLRDQSWLVVVGDDDPEPFQRMAVQAGVGGRVLFTGGRPDVADFYRAADLLLHPAYSENTGNTLLEAMVCGLPVLVTANCGYAHYVHEADAGLLCPQPFIQDRLNHLLIEALDVDKRQRWRANALAYCANHDLYSRVDQACAVILDKAAQRRAAAGAAAP